MGIDNVLFFIKKDIDDWMEDIDSKNYTDRISRCSFCLRYMIFYSFIALILQNKLWLVFTSIIRVTDFSNCSSVISYTLQGLGVLIVLSFCFLILSIDIDMKFRRLHDIGVKGIWVFVFYVITTIPIWVIPLVDTDTNNLVIILVYHLIVLSIYSSIKGDPSPNQYGNPP